MSNSERVAFERPALSELTQEYTVVDLHFHSRYSDGFNRVKSIVRRARSLGIGIAVTDHNEIAGAVRLAQYADILTIPGIEVTSREGAHVLVYFYDIESLIAYYEAWVKPFMGKGVMASISLEMEDVISTAKRFPCLVIFPHPFCAIYTGVCNPTFSKERQLALFEMADGVEAINAGNLKKWNLQSAVLGFNLGKSMTGGSDGHNLFQMGMAVTYAEPAADRVEFLDAVREGRSRVIGKETDLFHKVTSNSYKLRTSIKNYPHLLEKNVRFGYTLLNLKSRQVKDSVYRKMNMRLHRKGHGAR